MKARILLLVLAFSGGASAQQPTAGVVGRISAADGDVRYNGALARVGQNVFEGAVIETGNGRATVLVGGESVVHIDENSRFRFSDYDKKVPDAEIAVMELSYGRTRALVRKSDTRAKRFQFRTRAAVMGVRGTHIYIESPKEFEKPLKFVTIEGVADVYLPQARITKPADVVSMQTANIDDGAKFRKVELRGSEAISQDTKMPELPGKRERLPQPELERIGGSIVKPPRYVRTEEEIGEEDRDRRRKRRARDREMDLHDALKDRAVFDPIADGGVLVPATIKATTTTGAP